MKVALAVLVAFLALGAGVLVAVLLSLQSVSSSNHRWCDTLTLLSSHPVPKPSDPAANPSREAAYVFYTDIVKLRREFGC